MRNPILFLAFIAIFTSSTVSLANEKVRLTGSGASFPAPIYLSWFKSLNKVQPDIIVDYQSKGSGAGVQDFLNKTVDFAASDSAMTKEDIAKVAEGVQLLPMTAGEIIITYNLPGNPRGLKLPRDVYPNIFLGKITKWNDPVIAAANPGVKLPDMAITVVVRADSSGTTAVFTKHLSAVNEEFKNKLGEGNTVNWPVTNNFIKSPKNDGVTATVRQTPGAIGYIENSYAKLAKVETAWLQNREGKFVAPGNSAKTLASIKIPEDMIAWEPDPEGVESYPIVTYTWMIFRRNNGDANKINVLHRMIEYGLGEGQKIADAMGYIPLPQEVIERVRKAAGNIK